MSENKIHNVTLTMIVKDESHIIKDCLESVWPFIDYYCIDDTGSTDDTKKIIKEFFDSKGIQGEIHDEPWKNFGHNRSQVLKRMHGKTQWAIMIDADDYISGKLPIEKFDPKVDGYAIKLSRGHFQWDRVQIFNLISKQWIFHKPLHEYAFCEEPKVIVKLTGDFKWNARTEGHRTIICKDQKEKYQKDYDLLKAALEEDPTDERNQFYLAQSAFDMQNYELAEKEYLTRIAMGKWPEEVYFAWLRVGMCRELMGRNHMEAMEAFLNAYNAHPHRAESLYYLSSLCRRMNMPAAGFIYAAMATTMPYPEHDILFVDSEIYKWGIMDEVASTAWYAGKPHVGFAACKKLLEDKIIPEEHMKRVQDNFNCYGQIIAKIQAEHIARQNNIPMPTEPTKLGDFVAQAKKKEVPQNMFSTTIPEIEKGTAVLSLPKKNKYKKRK